MTTANPKKPKARWQAGNRDSKADDSNNTPKDYHGATVIGRVQAALRSGRTLTPMDAWIEFGTSRLAAVVHRLKREGMPILAREIEVNCRDGRTARVAEYRLIETSVRGAQ